jgi:predicted alpha/beta-fold hydrolase
MSAQQSLVSPYRAPWWLPEGHSQTLWRRFAPPTPIRRRRQRVELSDGDFIDVDWVDAAEASAGSEQPIVFLLHGLCGSSLSPYIQSQQILLQQRAISSVAMNFRGCSGEINRRARAYHSGCTEDVEEVFQALRAQYPRRSFAFAGFSLGGNVLLKWLAEIGQREGVLGAVAVSTPFSLSYCSEALNSGMSKLYGHYFRRRLIEDVERKRVFFRHHARHPGWQVELDRLDALGDLRRLKTLWEFDDQVTAPLHGFSSAEDYYARCSSGPRLQEIKSKVTLIQSANDPIIPVVSLPSADALQPHISLNLEATGGHVGFTCAGNAQWLEEQVCAALSRMNAPTGIS